MTKKFIEEQKKKLEDLKEKLEEQLSSFAKKDEDIEDNWKSHFPKYDSAETGDSKLEVAQDEVEDYLNTLPVEHALEQKLKDINISLENIKKGEYGMCENCSRKIPLDRLSACPEARFCLKCK